LSHKLSFLSLVYIIPLLNGTKHIGKVEYRMHGNFVGIYRDGILFVKVKEEELYLLNDQGIFVKVDNKEHDIQDKLKNAYNLALIVT